MGAQVIDGSDYATESAPKNATEYTPEELRYAVVDQLQENLALQDLLRAQAVKWIYIRLCCYAVQLGVVGLALLPLFQDRLPQLPQLPPQFAISATIVFVFWWGLATMVWFQVYKTRSLNRSAVRMLLQLVRVQSRTIRAAEQALEESTDRA
jgi:hypothetical protein